MSAINIRLKVDHIPTINELKRLHTRLRTNDIWAEKISVDRPKTYIPNLGLYKEEIMGQNSHWEW
jgi:hypothetical protein